MKIYKSKVKIKFQLKPNTRRFDYFSDFSKFLLEYYATLTPIFLKSKSFFKVIRSSYKHVSENSAEAIIEGELYNLSHKNFASAKMYITMRALQYIKSRKFTKKNFDWSEIKMADSAKASIPKKKFVV